MVFNIPKTKEKKVKDLKEDMVKYKLLQKERRIRAEEDKKKRLGLNHKNNDEILGILFVEKILLEKLFDEYSQE